MSDRIQHLKTITADRGKERYLFVPYYNDAEDKIYYLAYVENDEGVRHITPAFSTWQDKDLKKWAIDKVKEYGEMYKVTTWIDDTEVYEP